MIAKDEVVICTDQLEIVGFNGTPLSDFGSALPLVHNKLRDIYFKDRGDGSISTPILYHREEIEEFARQGRLTLLAEPLGYEQDSVAVYVKGEFYEELRHMLSEAFVWRSLRDSETKVTISNAQYVDELQNVWAKELLKKSTRFLRAFFVYHNEGARGRAERLADMALVAADDKSLRHEIYVRYSSAILASDMPERFSDLYSLFIAREYPDYNEASFRAKVKAFESSLEPVSMVPQAKKETSAGTWIRGFGKGMELFPATTPNILHVPSVQFRGRESDNLFLVLLNNFDDFNQVTQLERARNSPARREGILGYLIQAIWAATYHHPINQVLKSLMRFGRDWRIFENYVGRQSRNRTTRMWMRMQSELLVPDAQAIHLLSVWATERIRETDVDTKLLLDTWSDEAKLLSTLANSGKHISGYQLINQLSKKLIVEATDETSSWDIATNYANKFRRRHLLGDHQIKQQFEDIAWLDRGLCPYSAVFGALPATYKSGALVKHGDQIFVDTKRIMDTLHERRQQNKPISQVDALFYNAYTRVASRQR